MTPDTVSACWVLTKWWPYTGAINLINEKNLKRIKISDCISCWDQLRTDLGWLSQTSWRAASFRLAPAPLSIPHEDRTLQTRRAASNLRSHLQSCSPLSPPAILAFYSHFKTNSTHSTSRKRQTAQQAEHLLPAVDGKDYLYLRLFSEKLWFMTSKTCFWKLKALAGSPQSLSNTGISKWKQNALICPVWCAHFCPLTF